VHLFQVGAPERTVVLEEFQESLPEDLPGALVFTRAGTALASSTQNGTTRIWPLAGAFDKPPKPVVIGTRHAAFFNLDAAAAFSPDSRLLATGGSGNEIQLWNVADPRRPVIAGPPLTGHRFLVYGNSGDTRVRVGVVPRSLAAVDEREQRVAPAMMR
jgi:WD40 repeat protein